MAYGDAHKAAMDWLSNQGFSQGQISDAINKVRQQRNSGMSNSDIMNDVRKNTGDYFGGRPMYNPGNTMNGYLGEDSSYDAYDDYEEPPKSWEDLHPAIDRNVGGRNFNLQSHEDGSITMKTGGFTQTYNKGDKMYDFVKNYLNNETSNKDNTNPYTTGADSGLGEASAQNRDVNYWKNFDALVDHGVKQGMSKEDAFNYAHRELNLDTISTSKKDKEAEINVSSTKDDETPEGTVIDGIFDNEEGEGTPDTDTSNTDKKDVSQLNGEKTWENLGDDEKNEVIQIALQQLGFTPSTESNVVENKAKVSKDPIFDYQTYFNENLSGPKNVGKTGQVKNKIEQGPLTNVRSYDEETTTALQNLGFLQPDTEAANNMPDTVEQEQIKTFENPEQLMTDFDSKLTEMQSTNGIAPQAVAQTYMDYRNQLAKYIRENKIPDEEAAAMFDQLKKNEKLNELLTQSNK